MTQHVLYSVLRRLRGWLRPRPVHGIKKPAAVDACKLEDRVLYSVSPGAELVAVAPDGSVDAAVACDFDLMFDAVDDALLLTDEALVDGTTAWDGPAGTLSSPGQSESSGAPTQRELIFVDSSVQDYELLLENLVQDSPRNSEWFVLDADRDGIEQISAILADRSMVDAVHFVTHGTNGALQLGNTRLDSESLSTRAGDVAQWGLALSGDADLLFYGCRLAETSEGRTLADSLSALTGADVAASADDTGHMVLGGDWDLEYTHGIIDADLAFSRDAQELWVHLMTVPTASDDSYSIDEDGTLTVSHGATGSATGLVGWWQLDDGSPSQTAADASGSGSTGTLGSAAGADSADPTWTTAARVGSGALVFDGTDDYVQTASNDVQTATEFTLSAWFKADVTTGQHHILWQGVGTANGWGEAAGGAGDAEMHLTVGRFDADNKINFFMGYDDTSAARIEIVSAGDFTDTTSWHHAAVVVSDLGGGSVSAELYVDGVLEGSDSGSQTDRSFWDTDLSIGRTGAATGFFEGQIDEVRVYDRAISNAEVAELWQAGVLLNDSDADSDPLTATLVTGPSDGTLTLHGDGSFDYTPDPGFSGTDTFTYKANDGGADSNEATVTIAVNAVNDAPDAAVPGAQATVEDTPLTFSTLNGNLISIADEDLGAGLVEVSLSVTNGKMTLNGVSGLTFSDGDGVADGLLTFEGNLADVNTALDGLVFTPGTDLNGLAILTVSVDDQGHTGAGGPMADAEAVIISVSAQNDAPTIDNLDGDTLDYDEGDGVVLVEQGADVLVTDPDSVNFNSGSFVVSVASGGDASEDVLSIRDQGLGAGEIGFDGSGVYYGGALIGTATGGSGGTDLTVSLNPAADAVALAALAQNVTYENTDPAAVHIGARTIRFNASDGDGGTSLDYDATVNVYGVNDAPVQSGIEGTALSYTENDGALAVTGSLTLTDPDDTQIESATIQITGNYASGEDVLVFGDTANITGGWDSGTGRLTLTGADTVAAYETALRSVAYENTSDDPATATRTIQFTVHDGDADSNALTRDVVLTAENDAPLAASIEGSPLAYTENDGAVAVTGSLTVTDVDDTQLESAVIQFSVGYDAGEDVLAFADTANITGSWDSGTGTLTLTGTDTVANYQAAVRSVTYENTSDDPSVATRTVRITANDGDANSIALTRDINVTAENDAPVAAAVEGSPLAYTEGDGPVVITGTLTLSDADDAQLDSAEIRIASNYMSGEDVLVFADTANITGSWDSVTGTLTLAGTETVAGYEAALRSVTYENGQVDPSTATRTVSFTVNDSQLDSNTLNRDIAVTRVNVAPVQSGIEGTPLAYIENDGTVAITGTINLSDSDNTDFESASIRISGNFASGQDQLVFADTSNISGAWDSGTGTLTLTGTDTVANYQAAVRTVMYENTSEDPSAATRTIEFTVNDGTDDSNALTRDITLAPVNDSPMVDLDANDSSGASGSDHLASFVEDGGPVSIADLDAAAMDDDNSVLTSAAISLTSRPDGADETLSANTSGTSISASYSSATGVLTLSGADTAAHYTQVLRSVGYENASQDPDTADRTVVVTFSDGAATSNAATATVSVTSVNDAPIVADETYVVAEDQTLNQSAGAGLLINDSDLESSPLNATLVSGPANGNVTVNANGALTYVPDPDYSGTDQFTYRVTDNLGASSLATATITVTPVNDAPLSVEDAYATNYGETLTTTAGQGLLANDVDVDNDTLQVVLIQGPRHGNLTLSADGAFQYDPHVAYFGADSFTYRTHDGQTTSNIVTVTVDVQGAPEPPPNDPDSDNEPTGDDNQPQTDAQDPLVDVTDSAGFIQYAMPDREVSSAEHDELDRRQANNRELRGESVSASRRFQQITLGEESPDEDATERKASVESFVAHHDWHSAMAQLDVAPRLTGPVSDHLSFTLETGRLDEALDALDDAVREEEMTLLVLSSTVGVGTALTVGYVLWGFNGGYLLANLVSSLHAWNSLDPLPILQSFDAAALGDPKREDRESLESIVQQQRTMNSDR